MNKGFPSKTEYQNQMRLGMQSWTKRNGLQSATAYHLCQLLTFPTCANTSGPNIPNRSLATSPSPPSIRFNKLLKAQSSIAKTNNPHPYVSTSHASTTNPSNKHFKILPSSNSSQTIQPPLSLHWLRLYNDNMEGPIPGQLEMADNYRQAISWQNERKTFVVADPSSPLGTHHFVPCSTSWPDSSSN